MIIINDVYKRYKSERESSDWVLHDINLTIPSNVSVALIGANGAGKSTLMSLIGGVDKPNKGTVERHCRVSWSMGFGGGLHGALTGRQNAKFVCRVHGYEDDIKARLAYIQDFAGIGDAFDRPVKSYSAGMKSRLQFGLSLAFDFDVYLSDEVTSTGDAAFRKKAADSFKKLADHSSIIMVSHDEGTLKEFCTAGILIADGAAHWFDHIDDALKSYKDGRPK